MRGTGRGLRHARFRAHCATLMTLFPAWPSVPCALLHCGADKLADQRQELLGVARMELLQQGEQSQHKRRPVHGVGGFPAHHSCKRSDKSRIMPPQPRAWLWQCSFATNAHQYQNAWGPRLRWQRSICGNYSSGLRISPARGCWGFRGSIQHSKMATAFIIIITSSWIIQ